MSASTLAFWVLAVLVLATGIMSIRSTNITRSAYSLIVCFLGVAGIYALLGYGFMALAQVLVYGGAIAVLLLFAIMTVMQPEVRATNLSHPRRWIAGGVIGIIVLVSSGLLIKEMVNPKLAALTANPVNELARLMMGAYVIPLEAAALLLLIALIGAVILVKEA